ncbi:hypothetical protein [Phascolarctobacterium sp.]|uniref:hypothetical protein n=1 Tax=Phascolarctobacterium sp. TaxID=2049039 RepID=UPI00386F3C19
MRKNYLRDLPDGRPPHKNKASLHDYLQAFLDFLRRPKTVFDFKDRSRFVLLLIVIIILLQKVVEFFAG